MQFIQNLVSANLIRILHAAPHRYLAGHTVRGSCFRLTFQMVTDAYTQMVQMVTDVLRTT